MKHLAALPCLAASLVALATLTPAARGESASQTSAPITAAGLGAAAGAQYHGDGLSVAATPEGARLRCVFQKLEGQVTPEGLWLTSTAENANGERFRIRAVSVGRTDESGFGALPDTGVVTVADKLARFIRPGVTEEYSVSVDGVRQDFLVTQRPAGDGALRVELDVTGAKADALANGARLVLDGTGRKIAYTRLNVVDAAGKELPARMEVVSCILPAVGGVHPAATRLAVLVDDAEAKYPVQIDPTFSDDDWIGLGSVVNGVVYALAMSGSNLYVGGQFTMAGGIAATNVAKWNGSAWSALGDGVNSRVYALVAAGGDLYAGGFFSSAGGSNANCVAKWDGTAWSALGSGVSSIFASITVYALAVSGSDLYVGGDFTSAGGNPASGIAKWNGNVWSALGSGVYVTGQGNGYAVRALAVSGSDLYAGGYFTMAGGIFVTNIAKWNGSAWSTLGAGVSGGAAGQYPVRALAVAGSELYVGGAFTTAGDNSATNVAKWNGSTWSALGTGVGAGMFTYVYALAVSGADLYAGGGFSTAGGISATNIAKWDGSVWSALGSGVNTTVRALTVLGSDLYVGGSFNTAGGKVSTYLARAMTAPPVFTSITPNPSGTEALLTYSTAPGASLHLLSSPDLITWQTNTTVTATDVTNSVSVNLTQPQEFFHLRRLP